MVWSSWPSFASVTLHCIIHARATINFCNTTLHLSLHYTAYTLHKHYTSAAVTLHCVMHARAIINFCNTTLHLSLHHTAYTLHKHYTSASVNNTTLHHSRSCQNSARQQLPRCATTAGPFSWIGNCTCHLCSLALTTQSSCDSHALPYAV